jgi:hypothetical protein
MFDWCVGIGIREALSRDLFYHGDLLVPGLSVLDTMRFSLSSETPEKEGHLRPSEPFAGTRVRTQCVVRNFWLVMGR